MGRQESILLILEPAGGNDPRHLGALGGGQDEVKIGPKTDQDGPKSMSKMKMKKDSLQDRLGAILSRSWVV